ncbi:MAG: CRISPR-associated helicase Cas3' [Candidatus Eremiobacteraeota bacterium]|nr:CRISPR-associated helicase Cas3' [Candidatus Eremiobacteraeota bacterium]
MIDLNSHPDLQLQEHIAQVQCAVDSLCGKHSPRIITARNKELLRKIVKLHDMGKGTSAFQDYIKDPIAFRGDRMKKAHTPLSLLIVLLLAKRDKWEFQDTLIISTCVFGHHKGVPYLENLREIGIGDIAKLLKSQIVDLLIDALYQHTDIDIASIINKERPWKEALIYLDDNVLPAFEKLSTEETLSLRLKMQFLFSVLLEGDKALLAVKNPGHYLNRVQRIWNSQWVENRIGTLDKCKNDHIRQSIRNEMVSTIDKIQTNGIFSLTAPTGTGKTLLSATWLLRLREKFNSNGVIPKAIIVLPFLSIIDQTIREYKELLRNSGESEDGTWLLGSHSLSDRKYGAGLEGETEHFFIDTWRSELVITTYDQFLLTLIDPKARYQMRFHNLCDALIVMDEVQSLPCRLWKPLEEIMKVLMNQGNTSLLLMSATLPSIIQDAMPLIKNYKKYFEKCNRYRLRFRQEKKQRICDFAKELLSERCTWLREGKRILITLNTRSSARFIRDSLLQNWPDEYSHIPLLFLSADVTPMDRLEKIGIIKQGKPCIVVSTQCIEAGVDIDMDHVIRDFAPLDNIIQIAGRCNRNERFPEQALVEIVDLINQKGKRYSEMIYDEVHLQVTWHVLEGMTDIEEKDILTFSEQYFEQLTRKKDTGNSYLEKFAKMRDSESVKTLLRGLENEKYEFIVIKLDPDLREAMKHANEEKDRWKRREAWRALAGRIARISISLYAKTGFEPGEIAEEYLGNWLLKDSLYSQEYGLNYYEEPDDVVKIL